MAVYSLPIEPQDRVLIGRAEYGANAISLLQLQRRTGCQLVLIEDDEHGQIDLDALERALAEDETAMVSLVHVPTQSGLVNPAVEVGRLCREAGVLFVLDACQSAGQLPLDVARARVRHPHGQRPQVPARARVAPGSSTMHPELIPRVEPVMLDLHAAPAGSRPTATRCASDAGRFEMWERDAAAQIGLGVAVDHALGWGIDAIAERNAALAAGLRARLAEIPGVTVRDRGEQLCAITTFTVDGLDPEDVRARLRAEGVNVSVTTLDSAQLDLSNRGLESVVRASVHYVTTEDELDRFAERLRAVIAGDASRAAQRWRRTCTSLVPQHPEDLELRMAVPEVRVAIGQIGGIAGVELLGLVELGVAGGGRVGPDPADGGRPGGSGSSTLAKCVGWAQLTMK